ARGPRAGPARLRLRSRRGLRVSRASPSSRSYRPLRGRRKMYRGGDGCATGATLGRVSPLDLRLAPMAAVTNAPFRLVARECGAGLLTSEEIDARARALRKAVGVPLTIKIRGGWDDRRVNAVEIARLAEGEGVDAITVHPRTRSQQFAGLAPWEIIASVVDAVAIPVTGNGDVRSHDDARAMVRATGCAAVMIGRGALGAPS